MAGSEALRQCLADPGVERVAVITRRPTGVAHAKLTEVALADFLDYGPLLSQLAGTRRLSLVSGDLPESRHA